MLQPSSRSRASCYLAAIVLVGACRSVLRPATGPSANDDIVISAAQFGHTVDVRVGQTLVVSAPAASSAWQIDYSDRVLLMLTPADSVRSPDPDGWRFRAIAAGSTDLALTLIVQTAPGASVRPPAPPRFVVTIHVQ